MFSHGQKNDYFESEAVIPLYSDSNLAFSSSSSAAHLPKDILLNVACRLPSVVDVVSVSLVRRDWREALKPVS